jgi:hypothetical protein
MFWPLDQFGQLLHWSVNWAEGSGPVRHVKRSGSSHMPGEAKGYWQPGNLKLSIFVLQLNVPLDFRYSFVYQNVQSSTGSTVMAL